jgi:hypothetical protein
MVLAKSILLGSLKHEHDVLPSIGNVHSSIKNSHLILNILMLQ